MTKAIFWDNDGILVDTERLYFEATRDVLATVGVSLSRAQYVDLFMVHSSGAWHLAQAMGLSDSAVDQLRIARDRRYCERLAKAPLLMPGIVDVLEALHGVEIANHSGGGCLVAIGSQVTVLEWNRSREEARVDFVRCGTNRVGRELAGKKELRAARLALPGVESNLWLDHDRATLQRPAVKHPATSADPTLQVDERFDKQTGVGQRDLR